MFGIGFGEMMVLAVVLLIAVGPKKMPTFAKTVGKALREFRHATRELKNSVGLDELMRDEDLAELRKPLSAAPAPSRRYKLTEEDHARERPAQGVDSAHAEAHPSGQGVSAEPLDATSTSDAAEIEPAEEPVASTSEAAASGSGEST